jgi:hypothetical protein
MNWCIFYPADTFSSDDGSPYDAPGHGVQIIVQEHEKEGNRPYFVHMGDFYVWRGDRWMSCDYSGLEDYLFEMKPDYARMALKGRTLKNEDWEKIHEQAKKLRDEWHDHPNV